MFAGGSVKRSPGTPLCFAMCLSTLVPCHMCNTALENMVGSVQILLECSTTRIFCRKAQTCFYEGIREISGQLHLVPTTVFSSI